MAPSGIPLDLYDALRAAEKREKAARQRQSDMLVDLALENAHLRHALERVTLEARATEAGSDPVGFWHAVEDAERMIGRTE